MKHCIEILFFVQMFTFAAAGLLFDRKTEAFSLSDWKNCARFFLSWLGLHSIPAIVQLACNVTYSGICEVKWISCSRSACGGKYMYAVLGISSQAWSLNRISPCLRLPGTTILLSTARHIWSFYVCSLLVGVTESRSVRSEKYFIRNFNSKKIVENYWRVFSDFNSAQSTY